MMSKQVVPLNLFRRTKLTENENELSIFAEVFDYFLVKLDALIVTFYQRSCIILRIGMQLHFIINATGGYVVGKALKTVLHYVLILGSMKPEYLFGNHFL